MERLSASHYLNLSLDALKDHDLQKARKALDQALALDFEDPIVLGFLKYLIYWHERQGLLDQAESNFEKCELLISQWSNFQAFKDRIGLEDDRILYGIRQYVFGRAMRFLSVYNNEAGAHDPEILSRMGICFKCLGNFDMAVRFLEGANKNRKDDPQILAELADAYALVNEPDLSKVVFREAFFIDAQQIRLETLDSGLIRKIIESVKKDGYLGKLVNEWIPIYGQLLGVFNVSRELRALEYGKLLQAIYQLERELMDGTVEKDLQIPRLVNKYFWLLDYYQRSSDEQKRIKELLLKIKGLAPRIYEQYTS